MASLFLARRQGAAGFARHVAVKVVHEHLVQDMQFVRMFVDEAKLAARIQHPNVVHVEELGEQDGTYFLVMEYVHGCSLAELLSALAKNRRRMSSSLAVWTAMQVAEGLHAAHETTDSKGEPLGVVHRDVSPQNVLLAAKGHVKLIDFGIAKARGRQQSTVGGALKGKFRYMAPEQAASSRVDRRTDVYALGIVLWEMLAMRRLFSGETDVELLDQVRDPQIVPPSQYASHVPPELDRVVMSALARDPAERPQTALELRRSLAEAMPTAGTLDAAQLAAVIDAVLGEELERRRQQLPSSMLSGLWQPLSTQKLEGETESAGEAAGEPESKAESESEVEADREREGADPEERQQALRSLTVSAPEAKYASPGGSDDSARASASAESGSSSPQKANAAPAPQTEQPEAGPAPASPGASAPGAKPVPQSYAGSQGDGGVPKGGSQGTPVAPPASRSNAARWVVGLLGGGVLIGAVAIGVNVVVHQDARPDSDTLPPVPSDIGRPATDSEDESSASAVTDGGVDPSHGEGAGDEAQQAQGRAGGAKAQAEATPDGGAAPGRLPGPPDVEEEAL
jgi:serine/threonine-protein kinase